MKRKKYTEELKGRDRRYSETAIQNKTETTTTPWSIVNHVEQGVASNQRVGNQIKLKSVRWRGVIRSTFLPFNGQYQAQWVRIVMLLIRNPSNLPAEPFWNEQVNPDWGTLFNEYLGVNPLGEKNFLGLPSLLLGSTIKIIREQFIKLEPPTSGQELSGTMTITDGTGSGSTTQQMEPQIGEEVFDLFGNLNVTCRWSDIHATVPIQNVVLVGAFPVKYLENASQNEVNIASIMRFRWTE